MVKEIIWSAKAREDQLEILDYWHKRNKSSEYPKKLFRLITDAINKLSEVSMPRRSTDFPGVNVTIVRSYKIFFKENENSIFVICIWDTRQKPEKLHRLLEL